MTNYSVTLYATVAAFEAATIATTETFLAVPYREGCTTKVLYVTPDPRAAA